MLAANGWRCQASARDNGVSAAIDVFWGRCCTVSTGSAVYAFCALAAAYVFAVRFSGLRFIWRAGQRWQLLRSTQKDG